MRLESGCLDSRWSWRKRSSRAPDLPVHPCPSRRIPCSSMSLRATCPCTACPAMGAMAPSPRGKRLRRAPCPDAPAKSARSSPRGFRSPCGESSCMWLMQVPGMGYLILKDVPADDLPQRTGINPRSSREMGSGGGSRLCQADARTLRMFDSVPHNSPLSHTHKRYKISGFITR